MSSDIRYFSVDISHASTPYVECLSSYINHLARAHRQPAYSMLTSLSTLIGFNPAKAIGHLLTDEGRTLNQYGVTQRTFTSAVGRAQERSDVAQMTLAAFSACLAANGMGSVKGRRHWCPSCYADARRGELERSDMLVNQLVELAYCPIHEQPLACCCPSCGAGQPMITSNGVIDMCVTCMHWLGAASDQQHPKPDAYQQWLMKELPKLLSIRKDIEGKLAGIECGAFLRAIVSTRHVTQLDLASYLEVPIDTFRQWTMSRFKPKLQSWLRVCANLSVSPADTFLDPYEAAKQLPFPFQSPQIYLSAPLVKRRTYDKNAIRDFIQNQIEAPQPDFESIPAISVHLCIPISMLYFHAGDEIGILTLRLRGIKQKRKNSRLCVIRKSSLRIVKRLQKEQRILTRAVFTKELMNRVGCSQRLAKEEFKSVVPKQ